MLIAIFEDHTIRVRDIATRCQLNERAVQKIIVDLEEGGCVTDVGRGRGCRGGSARTGRRDRLHRVGPRRTPASPRYQGLWRDKPARDAAVRE
ncbi:MULTISPECIES: hypothetical protein [Streptomyces violaceusniger group]|uniref:hypothetical protein n=1 Tax=Streptomyces javensis TaxID=114698 RepID=UPI002812684C|nr:hypothetical protein [Streptomyces javensis]